VVKRCYSALVPGSSPLHDVLQARGVTHVLVGGTVTNVCCESTARDAMMMDYATIMVEDALSAVTPQEHEQSLQNWMLFFGDVLSTRDVIERLGA
jgi:nicotinamidase-related amidase